MAYNVSTYGSNDMGRGDERRWDNRPMPFAVPAGGPIPNIGPSKAETNTTPALSTVTDAAQAKRLFKPKQDVPASHKMAYDLGLMLGQKAAAYPLQEFTPGHDTVPNMLPEHAPTPKSVKAPNVVWPQRQSTKKNLVKPVKPKPVGLS